MSKRGTASDIIICHWCAKFGYMFTIPHCDERFTVKHSSQCVPTLYTPSHSETVERSHAVQNPQSTCPVIFTQTSRETRICHTCTYHDLLRLQFGLARAHLCLHKGYQPMVEIAIKYDKVTSKIGTYHKYHLKKPFCPTDPHLRPFWTHVLRLNPPGYYFQMFPFPTGIQL